MSAKVDILEVLSDVRRNLWIFGLYHGKHFPKYPSFAVRRAATVAIITVFPILILAKILVWRSEFAMLTKQLSFLVLTIWVTVRTILYISSLSKERELEDLLRDDIFNVRTKSQNRFISVIKDRQRILIRVAMVLGVSAPVFFRVPAMVSSTNTNIPIWTPFHGRKEDIVIAVYEAFAFLIMAFTYSIQDCNFIGLTNIVTAQIEILKDNLKHVTDIAPKDEYTKQERKIQERLRKCIIHHNATLNLTRRLEERFSSTLFFQVIFAALEICFFGMQLVIGTDTAQLAFWFLCFVTLIGEILVSCWCGQDFISESSGIIEACYMSEWYIYTPSTRKMFLIIMEQAKRPMTLNGGPFFTLSFDIFVNVLRSAYSYYAVFRQIYRR